MIKAQLILNKLKFWFNFACIESFFNIIKLNCIIN